MERVIGSPNQSIRVDSHRSSESPVASAFRSGLVTYGNNVVRDRHVFRCLYGRPDLRDKQIAICLTHALRYPQHLIERDAKVSINFDASVSNIFHGHWYASVVGCRSQHRLTAKSITISGRKNNIAAAVSWLMVSLGQDG